MDAKKTIMGFIKPKLVLVITLLILFPLTFFGLIMLLCVTIPTFIRAKKNIAKLEANGELEKAAAEIMSASAKRLVNGKVIFTENYIFCKGAGFIFTYDEVLWAYKHRFTRSILFIPIIVTDSLYLATKEQKPKAIASMGKDKMDEIKNAILEIYKHNSKCLIGYTEQNAASYKVLSK